MYTKTNPGTNVKRKRNHKGICNLAIVGFVGLLCMYGFNFFLFPVEVKKKEVDRFTDFQQGEFKGTALDNKGKLFIGPRIDTVTGPGREYYLAVDTAANGDIYLGTGHKASVYRIKSTLLPKTSAGPNSTGKPGSPGSPDSPGSPGNPGNIEEIFHVDDLDVFALMAKDNGDVYIGTSPEGKIYKVSLLYHSTYCCCICKHGRVLS